jgi:hypothetical protein
MFEKLRRLSLCSEWQFFFFIFSFIIIIIIIIIIVKNDCILRFLH